MEKLGLEMEMVVADAATGRSHAVDGYFEALARRKAARGIATQEKRVSGRTIALMADDRVCGLDNGFNHLETALGPVHGGAGGLRRLEGVMREELGDVIETLAEEGALLLNTSEHPDCPLHDAFYLSVRAPKPIYDYWIQHRGWRHHEGIDAKAQNGPTTSIPVRDGARAVNVMLGVAPALIALFANSPLEGGVATGLKENRLSLWPRMFRSARYASDRRLSLPPQAPFRDLGEYFRWCYDDDTVMHTVPVAFSDDYKESAYTARACGAPSLRTFLAAGEWPGVACDDGRRVMLQPSAAHFEHLQFAPFTDARFRFRFGSVPALSALLDAWERPGGVEALLVEHDTDAYIEGRMPGANFPDVGMLEETGLRHASSVVMAPAAIQAGLLANLEAAEHLLRNWGWRRLCGLRTPAIEQALDCSDIHALVGEVLCVARAGLAPDDQVYLDYAEWVWRNRRTGADRCLEWWRSWGGDPAERLVAYAQRFQVLHPQEWSAVSVKHN